MTKVQYLLTKLMEECAEVSQRASKQIQFGKLEIQNGQNLTNGQRLHDELVDLLVIAEMLQEEFEIPEFTDTAEFDRAYVTKKIKMQKYLDLSKQLGMLPEIIL